MLFDDVIRQDAAAVRVDAQAAFQWRDGALVTVFPRADAAGNADGIKAAFQVKPIGIDDGAGMGDFTAKADRIAAHGGQKRAAWF